MINTEEIIFSEAMKNHLFILGFVDFLKQKAIFHDLEECDLDRKNLYGLHKEKSNFSIALQPSLEWDQDNQNSKCMANYIFMTDFCGSTLLSKAIRLKTGVSTYNEPTIFKTLGDSLLQCKDTAQMKQANESITFANRLFGRSNNHFPGLVKEQPFTNMLIPKLVQRQYNNRAIILFSPLEKYLISVMKSDRRREYARLRVNEYKNSCEFSVFSEIMKESLNDSEIAVLHWLFQMHLFNNTIESKSANQLHILNSEDLFKNPIQETDKCIKFLGYQMTNLVSDSEFTEILLSKHAKQAGVEYTESDRLRENMDNRDKYLGEIEPALNWASNLIEKLPYQYKHALFPLR